MSAFVFASSVKMRGDSGFEDSAIASSFFSRRIGEDETLVRDDVVDGIRGGATMFVETAGFRCVNDGTTTESLFFVGDAQGVRCHDANGDFPHDTELKGELIGVGG